MNPEIPPFTGFGKEAFGFLTDLSNNNSLQWFADNRERYENFLVLPSKSFIVTIGQFFNQLNPAIRTEPKFDKTMMRINNDMRFAKGDPYKKYFLIHFGRFKGDSEYYVYLNPNGIEYGIYINNTLGKELYFNKNLPGHKDELIEVFSRFEINNKYDFYDLKKESELISRNYSINQDNFDTFARTKIILLQKELSVKDELAASADYLNEAIKTFSHLYPVYCFSFSHNPLALIEIFEEEMGIIK